MPFICSLYFNFATKVKSYESSKCKGGVLPQKERSGCQRQLPCDGEIDRRKILRSGIQFEDVGASYDVALRSCEIYLLPVLGYEIYFFS